MREEVAEKNEQNKKGELTLEPIVWANPSSELNVLPGAGPFGSNPSTESNYVAWLIPQISEYVPTGLRQPLADPDPNYQLTDHAVLTIVSLPRL